MKADRADKLESGCGAANKPGYMDFPDGPIPKCYSASRQHCAQCVTKIAVKDLKAG